MQEIGEQDLSQALDGPLVLLDIGAPWCGACKQLAPILARFAQEYPEVSVFTLNGDHNPNVLKFYGVTGFPTLLAFRDGNLINQFVGNPGSVQGIAGLFG